MSRLVEVFCATQRHQKTKNKKNETQTKVRMALHLPCRDTKTYSVLCVCVFSSHSLWTSSLLGVPAGVTQEEGHTEFLIHLLSAVRASIFLARRIQPSFPSSTVKPEFVY